ncbi:MAG: hypothetical protein WCG31_07385 [Deltaproteobacteria bacterium]
MIRRGMAPDPRQFREIRLSRKQDTSTGRNLGRKGRSRAESDPGGVGSQWEEFAGEPIGWQRIKALHVNAPVSTMTCESPEQPGVRDLAAVGVHGRRHKAARKMDRQYLR